MVFTTSFFLIISCNLAGTCGNDLIEQAFNNKNEKKVFVFFRDCGATTSTSVQVCVLSNEEKFDNDIIGNVFIADAKNYLDSNTLKVNWRSNDTLEIKFDKRLKIFTRENKVADVNVKYIEE